MQRSAVRLKICNRRHALMKCGESSGSQDKYPSLVISGVMKKKAIHYLISPGGRKSCNFTMTLDDGDPDPEFKLAQAHQLMMPYGCILTTIGQFLEETLGAEYYL